MRTLKEIMVLSAFGLIIGAVMPVAKADQGDWATKITIEQPIQVGDLVLNSGDYVFKRADIWAPDVVVIYNADTHRYVGMVQGIPAYRSRISDQVNFVIEKEGKGMPQALEYWYYPDAHTGIKFLHPQT